MISKADPAITEGLLVLVQELTELLGEEWGGKAGGLVFVEQSCKVKSRISTMISKALRTAI